MGRTLPVECHHGVTVDWGDFGYCQGDCERFHPENLADCPDLPGCDLCEQEEQRTEGVRWASIGDAIRGFLLEKHIPFDMVDEWADEIVAVVREHLAPPMQSGS